MGQPDFTVDTVLTPGPGEPKHIVHYQGSPMRIELTELLIEHYALMQVFRHFDFAPEHLFFASGLGHSETPEVPWYGVSLVLTETRQFNVVTWPQDAVWLPRMSNGAPVVCSTDVVERCWSDFVTKQNATPLPLDARMQRQIDHAMQHRYTIKDALIRRGFSPREPGEVKPIDLN